MNAGEDIPCKRRHRLVARPYLALIALALGLCSCSLKDDVPGTITADNSSATGQRQSIDSQFASIAENAISQHVVQGIQFSLIEDGRILRTQAFGLADREAKRAMTVDTPINVASISKPLTAWGLLVCAERGNLQLDANIGELLSGHRFYTEIFSRHDVTTRMLLSHTSGLSGPSVPVTPASEPMPSVSDILLGKSSIPRPHIKASPGTRFLYSGAGYLVLQEIIEQTTHRAFAEFMADAVLGPAQMFESTHSLAPEVRERVAAYYRSDGRRRDPYHLPGAAGGLYSTANDMARFIMLYTDSGRAIRRKIISDEGFEMLLSPIAIVNDADGRLAGVRYALGHYTYDTPEGTGIVYHAGGNPGLRALFVVAPGRNAGFFAVANHDRGSEVLSQMMKAWGKHYGITLHSYF